MPLIAGSGVAALVLHWQFPFGKIPSLAMRRSINNQDPLPQGQAYVKCGLDPRNANKAPLDGENKELADKISVDGLPGEDPPYGFLRCY